MTRHDFSSTIFDFDYNFQDLSNARTDSRNISQENVRQDFLIFNRI